MHLGPADRQSEREAAHQPPQVWYSNLEQVITDGDYKATFC